MGIYLVVCFTPSTPANHTDGDAALCLVNSSSVAVSSVFVSFLHTQPLSYTYRMWSQVLNLPQFEEGKVWWDPDISSPLSA